MVVVIIYKIILKTSPNTIKFVLELFSIHYWFRKLSVSALFLWVFQFALCLIRVWFLL